MPAAPEKVINHFGMQFPFRPAENASLPAPVAARMFLRHLADKKKKECEERLQVLGLMHMLAEKVEHYRAGVNVAALDPPAELVVEVSMSGLSMLGWTGEKGPAAGSREQDSTCGEEHEGNGCCVQ